MKRINFFEGWYFKEQSRELTIAFIPEISYDKSGKPSGSLQIVLPGCSYYLDYKNAINMNLSNAMFVVVGENVFTDSCIHLDVEQSDIKIKGDICFDSEEVGKFNVMGPLALIPMPCKHEVLSMEQKLSGSLEINGKTYNFDGGKGYLETDYGSSFPERYMWNQCNWFDGEDCRIAMAAALIPFGPVKVMGTFACIDYRGHTYKFATYKGAEVVRIGENGFQITEGPYIFEGRRRGGIPTQLKSPSRGEMSTYTREYPVCDIEYRLRKRGTEIFRVKSSRGSYEFL